MEWLLDFYTSHQDWINLIKDLVFFMGAVTIIKYLWNKRFNDKSALIEHALLKRDLLEKKLNEYVYEKHKNKAGIGIRFIFWKNYPNKLDDDAYAHELFTWPREENVLPSGFLNNTGVNFIEPLWRYSQSVYVNKSGIFFFDKKGQTYSEFQEVADSILVKHLPYKNIINFDFKEFIEYEPVFYTRYKYNSWKLFDNKIILRNRPENDWLNLELNQSNMLKKYSPFKCLLLQLKLRIFHLFHPERQNS